MLPVRESGEHDAVKVGQDRIERFADGRRMLRKRATDVARADLRGDRSLTDGLEI